jgi:hypothetical protein
LRIYEILRYRFPFFVPKHIRDSSVLTKGKKIAGYEGRVWYDFTYNYFPDIHEHNFPRTAKQLADESRFAERRVIRTCDG